VQIFSVEPNSDLEGDDDFIPFYNNRADIYGTVTINGVKQDLPKISEDDFPHWDYDHAPDAEHPDGGLFVEIVPAIPDPTGLAPLPVPISIQIFESDSGLTGDDNEVDINPSPDKKSLEFEFDLCSLRISGDISAMGAQGDHVSLGGLGDEDAEISFKVALLDGRPVSVDDAALMDLDFIQVIPHVNRLIAEKPTVLMARVANNYDVEISPQLQIRITGVEPFPIIDVFDLEPIGAGEVKKIYLYEDDPILFPEKSEPYVIRVVGTLDPEGALPDTGHSVPQDCRAQNNGGNNRIAWHVIETERPSVLWAKVGMDLDIGNFTPESHFDEIVDLGEAFIRGVYPTAGFDQSKSPIDIPVFITPGVDWLRAIIPGTDALDPFLMVAELGGIAAFLGTDRIMGVLPNKDWFERFEGWGSKSGVSLVDALPRAVTFLPRKDRPLGIGPAMTLPAHELGHTYGLSVDSALKPKWACALDLGDIGKLLCGAAGGYDEYENELEPYNKGNPARGRWIAQGGETSVLAHLLNTEQCDSHCFMGSTRVNAWLGSNWNSRGRWIDPSDYDHLIDKLRVDDSTPALAPNDAALIYISGMIASKGEFSLDGHDYKIPRDEFFLLELGHIQNPNSRQKADHVSSEVARIGQIRFLDSNKRVLKTGEIPFNMVSMEADAGPSIGPVPVTIFGLMYSYPERTREIEFVTYAEDNKYHRLSSKLVSEYIPEVAITYPKRNRKVKRGQKLSIQWTAHDKDDDDLRYGVAISPDRGQHWWPAAYKLDKNRFELDTDDLEAGSYTIRVMVNDGVHLGESEPRHFIVEHR
jgi:hypothetical protein